MVVEVSNANGYYFEDGETKVSRMKFPDIPYYRTVFKDNDLVQVGDGEFAGYLQFPVDGSDGFDLLNNENFFKLLVETDVTIPVSGFNTVQELEQLLHNFNLSNGTEWRIRIFKT